MTDETKQGDSQPTERSTVEPATEKPVRLFFADHLRALVVILVVVLHFALMYAGVPFYYTEPVPESYLVFLLLALFLTLNQAWSMGALFFLAGYFTPGSYDRKGPGSFLQGRLVRLGIPLFLYIFVLHPPLIYWGDQLSGAEPRNTLQYFDDGVLWFVSMLLIFDTGYVAWRMLTHSRRSSLPSKSSPPGFLALGNFLLGLALVTYLFRIVIPVEQVVLGFPSLSYLPQYLSFFGLGTVAYRRDWLRIVPNSRGVAGFVIAIVASVVLIPIAWLSGQHYGNGTWQSAVFALWDSTFAVGMLLAAITFFRRRFNGQGRFGRFLAQQSFAVYILHAHIVAGVAAMLGGVSLPVLLKLALASMIGVPLCFVVAYLVRKIPGVSRVI